VREVHRAELVAAIGQPYRYCGNPMAVPTRDHIRPRCRGGTLDGQNKALVCDPCNQEKGEGGRWPRGCTASRRLAIVGPRSFRRLSDERARGFGPALKS
jgi:HNH endonuclease